MVLVNFKAHEPNYFEGPYSHIYFISSGLNFDIWNSESYRNNVCKWVNKINKIYQSYIYILIIGVLDSQTEEIKYYGKDSVDMSWLIMEKVIVLDPLDSDTCSVCVTILWAMDSELVTVFGPLTCTSNKLTGSHNAGQ